MGKIEIEAFLTALAVVLPATQNQGFNALLLLYEQGLEIALKNQPILSPTGQGIDPQTGSDEQQ